MQCFWRLSLLWQQVTVALPAKNVPGKVKDPGWLGNAAAAEADRVQEPASQVMGCLHCWDRGWQGTSNGVSGTASPS